MPQLRWLPLFLLLASLTVLPARSADAFDQGSVSISAQVGVGQSYDQSYDQTYFVLGGSGGYYVLQGLKLGGSVSHWFGQEPQITQLSPSIEYALVFVPVVTPYVGAFYRYWIVSGGIDNFSTVGIRGGLYAGMGGVAQFYGGLVRESAVGPCSGTCSWIYPEVGVVFRF